MSVKFYLLSRQAKNGYCPIVVSICIKGQRLLSICMRYYLFILKLNINFVKFSKLYVLNHKEMESIPKVIHYCWFGRGPKPQSVLECISSWHKFMPDYHVKEWNEDNFDVQMTKYVEEAYRAGSYAHVSDVARFWILYNFGGVYFDTDIELLQSIDDIVSQGPFMGFEAVSDVKRKTVNPGLGIAAPAGHPFYKRVLDFYNGRHFIRMDGKSTGSVMKAMSKLMENMDFTPPPRRNCCSI